MSTRTSERRKQLKAARKLWAMVEKAEKARGEHSPKPVSRGSRNPTARPKGHRLDALGHGAFRV